MQVTKSYTAELPKSWEKLEVGVDESDLNMILAEAGVQGLEIIPKLHPAMKFVLMQAEADRLIAYWKRNLNIISAEELADIVTDIANNKKTVFDKLTL